MARTALIIITLIIGFVIPAQARDSYYEGIRIEGDDRYIKQVTSALKLLKDKAPDELGFVKKHVGRIKLSTPTSMNAKARPPVCKLSEKAAFTSLTWCASTLVHEATHSYLYKKYRGKKLKGNKLFAKTAGPDAEKFAIKGQIRAMRKIGGSQRVINFLSKQDGRHGDVNKDGWLDYKDYKLMKGRN